MNTACRLTVPNPWLSLAAGLGFLLATMGTPSAVLGQRASPAGENLAFTHQFLYGLVIFEGGKATLCDAQGKPTGEPLPPGAILKTGSCVGTPADGSAELRLACGSTLRLAPSSRVKILPFALTLESGACLARHSGSVFPLKIKGVATLLLSKDSVAEVERQGNRILARVQVGRLQTAGLKVPLTPGQTVEATDTSARLTEDVPLARTWDHPLHPPAPSSDAKWGAESAGPWADLETDLDSPMGDPPPKVEPGPDPAPLTPPVPPMAPEPDPKTGDPTIEGEDWMKNPIPKGGN